MLARRGPVSRTEIGAVIGLSSGAVSRITAGLIGEGLLREAGPARHAGRARVGRTPALLDLDDSLTAIGVHVQPDVISAVAASPNGRILQRERVAVSTRLLPDVAVERVAAAVETLLGRVQLEGRAPPVAAGVGVPGMVDATSGHVRHSAILGWQDVSIQRLLQQRMPHIPVTVTHNVSSMALAAHWFGPTGVRAAENLLLVYAGRGIGAGLVVRGEAYSGQHGHAGELGHIGSWSTRTCWCGRTGCLETVAGGPAILQEAARAMGMDAQRLTLRELLESAAADPRVQSILWAAGKAAGSAVFDAARVLDPGLIAVAGPVFSLRPFMEAFEQGLRGESAQADWARSPTLVDLPDLPALGAAAVALKEIVFTGAYRDRLTHGSQRGN